MLVTELVLSEDMAEKLPDEIAGRYWKMAVSIAEKEEHVPMFFVVVGRQMIQMVVSEEFRDVEGKSRVSKLIRSLARDADVVVFVTEAYSVRNPDKSATRSAANGRLCEHKDARELLTVMVQHRKYGTVFWSAEITNGTNGRTIGSVNTDHAYEYGGRFVNMFPNVTVAQA